MEVYYKFRIYPNHKQEELIQKAFGCCRFVYNYYLAKRIDSYKNNGTSLNYYDCAKDMTQLKKSFTWLREADHSALQSSLRDLERAYQNFFRKIKSGVKAKYPKFKRKHSNRKSYTCKRSIRVFENLIQLPKLGKVKCRVSKEVCGRILSATIIQTTSGKYFVSLCCTDVEFEQFTKTGKVVGIDLGLKHLATTSDGVEYPNNHYLKKSHKKLAKLQRRLSRKSKGSHNREKARIKVAKFREHITNQRKDYINKLTTDLIRKYDVVCIEDLNVSGMQKNRKLAESISDVAFYSFRRKLEYKAKWYGKKVSVIGMFYPSSQLCSNCGEKWSGTKDLSVREWTCPNCGIRHDRDVNAAKNILNEGLRLLA